MPDDVQTVLARRSPLARFRGDNASASMSANTVSVQELPFLGVIKLQCRDCTPTFQVAVKTILDIELPLAPNTRMGQMPACLWVAPNEWILVTAPDKELVLADVLSRHFTSQLPEENIAVTLITDSRVALKIQGVDAANLIAKGCGLDLHPTRFSYGQCAVSLLEQVTVLVYPEDDQVPTYTLFVDRSYAAFVWRWLEHASKEFMQGENYRHDRALCDQ